MEAAPPYVVAAVSEGLTMNTQRQLRSLITPILICAVSVAIPWCSAGAISEEDLERNIKIVLIGSGGVIILGFALCRRKHKRELDIRAYHRTVFAPNQVEVPEIYQGACSLADHEDGISAVNRIREERHTAAD
jgi:hypothetical protein